MAWQLLLGTVLGGMAGRAGKVNYEAPEPRDLYQEAMDTMRATEDVAPRYLALRQQYSPSMIGQNLADQRMSLFGTPATRLPGSGAAGSSGASSPTANQILEAERAVYAAEQENERWSRSNKKLNRDMARGRLNDAKAKLDALRQQQLETPAPSATTTDSGGTEIPAQQGLLGGPDAYRYDEQGNERGMAQRVDAYAREKVRQDFQAQRRGDIEDLRELAPQAREAYMAANPEVASRLAQVNRMADRAERRAPSALASYTAGGPASSGRATPGAFGAGSTPHFSEQVRRRIPRQAGAMPKGQAALPREQVSFAQTPTAQGTNYAQGRLGQEVSGLQRELETQAREELAAGSALTAREKRNLSESARSAFAGRGLERSNRALLGEMQNRIQGNRQRLAERRAFAAGVSGQGEMMRRGRLQDTMAAGAQQFGQMATAEQLRMAQDAQDQGFALNALNASRVVDPSQAILGRGLTATSAGAFQQSAGSGLAANQMNMNPFANQYAANLNSQNYQGAMAGAQGNMMADYYSTQNTLDLLGTGAGLLVGSGYGKNLNMIG